MAGRKKKRGNGQSGGLNFGEQMALARRERAAGGRKSSKKRTTKRSSSGKRTVTTKRSSTRSRSSGACTLAACRQLLARSEAAQAAAQRRRAQAAWSAGAGARGERAVSRIMGPPMFFGEPRPRREVAPTRERGRFEGTFAERMGGHGRGFEGPLSPSHDPSRRRKRGRKGRKAGYATRRGRRDASLMDMRDFMRARHDWPGDSAGHSRAAKKGWRCRPRKSRRDATYTIETTRTGRGRRDAGRRDARHDWPGDSAGHSRAAKKGWRRLCSSHRRGHRRDATYRDAAYDWPGDRAGHRRAARKGWRHRHACSHRRDAAYDWPGDRAGHSRAAKKGWRRRALCSHRSHRDASYR